MTRENQAVYQAIWDEMEGMDINDAAIVLGRLIKDWEEIAFNCDGQQGEDEFGSILMDATIPDHIAQLTKLN